MRDTKYDSVLVGYVEDAVTGDDGFQYCKFNIKDHELKEIAEKYATRRGEDGKGGNIYFTLFQTKSGKTCLRVWDPNSEAAKEKRAAKASEAKGDDLPF